MDRFEKDIQKKLQGFEENPPEEIWQAIESRLDQKKAGFLLLRRRIAAAAAILLLIASATTWLLDPLSFRSQQLASDNIQSPSETLAPASADIEQPINDATEEIIRQNEEYAIALAASSPKPSQQILASISGEEQQSVAQKQETIAPALFTAEKLSSISGPIPMKFTLSDNYTSTSPSGRIAPLIHTIPDDKPDSGVQLAELTRTIAFQPNPFTLSVYFAPQQAYRHQFNSAPNPLMALESEIMTFATGINASYRIHKRWEIISGIGYNRIGQRVHDIASFSHPSMMPLYSTNGSLISGHPQSMSTSMGGIVFTDQSFYFADISSSRINTLKGSYDESIVNLLNKTGTGILQYFEYLQMPVGARYKIFDRGLAVYANAGINMQYLLSGDVYLEERPQHSPIGKSVGMSKFNFAGTTGLGFSYPVSTRFSMSLEPTATMFLRPIGQVRNLSSETYPYTWSVLLGISYNL